MPYEFILTTAGKSAIVNANNTGTNPISITKIGFGSAAWTPTSSATALQTEIKKLPATSGGVVAADTIHVTANDSGSDAYVVREVGLFTANNILVAIYSQPTPIITKGSGTVALIATDLVIVGIPAGSITVGATSFEYPPATETVRGCSFIATENEAIAGTNNQKIMTPLRVAQRYIRKGGDIMTGILTLAANPTAAMHAATKSYVDARTDGDNMPVSSTAFFLSYNIPNSWREMNGQEVNRIECAELFSLWGTGHGAGNGTTTFNLPDFRGLFPRSIDHGRGLDPNRALATQQNDEIRSHAHGINLQQLNSRDTGSFGKLATGNEQAEGFIPDILTYAVGGSETRPRNAAAIWCVKVKRDF